MLRYRLIDIENEYDLRLLLKWYNDRLIRHLAFPHPSKAAYERFVTAREIRQRLKLKLNHDTYRMYIVEWHGEPIGEMSIEINAKPMKKKRPKGAWLGIVIGERHARGQGLGKRILIKLESIARDMGAKRAELGVFEFNRRAFQLYAGMGYEQFATDAHVTWWRGRMHGSLFMEKTL